jgi:hypothetical protein
MKTTRIKFNFSLAIVYLLATLGFAQRSLAQDSSGSVPMLKLYIDPETKVVYAEPGHGRRLLMEIPANAMAAGAIEQQEQRQEVQLRQNQEMISALVAKNQEFKISNRELNREMAEVKPAWRSYR